MSETAFKWRLTQLNHEIEHAESEAKRLEADRAAVAKDVARAARRMRYLRLAGWLRRPEASIDTWPVAILVVGSMLSGALFLILASLLSSSPLVVLFSFLLGIAIGAGALAVLLYRPPSSELGHAVSEAEAQLRLENARLAEKDERLSEVNSRLQKLTDERRDQVATGKLQRAALLQREWKAMRDDEWEDFIVEVCRTLGANVDRTGRGGPDEANLIADFSNRRVAIITQAAAHNVSSATIQNAVAARERYGCASCAVIINRRFTGAAQDYASRNGCVAIGASEFPDFVLGKIEL